MSCQYQYHHFGEALPRHTDVKCSGCFRVLPACLRCALKMEKLIGGGPLCINPACMKLGQSETYPSHLVLEGRGAEKL